MGSISNHAVYLLDMYYLKSILTIHTLFIPNYFLIPLTILSRYCHYFYSGNQWDNYFLVLISYSYSTSELNL